MNLLQPEIAARREARQKLNLINDQEAGFILINQQMHSKYISERPPQLAY